MSIARAFTMRSKRSNNDAMAIDHPDMPSLPVNRLTRTPSKLFDRSKISSPVLLSTTNVQTLNAMSISTAQQQQFRKVSSISSSSSRASDKDSDVSSTGNRSRGTSVTENSSVDGSSPSSPKPNDSPNNTYFSHSAAVSQRKLELEEAVKRESTISQQGRVSPSPRRAKSSVDLKARSSATSLDVHAPLPTIPAVPARASSHSKFAHEQLARKRSLQTLGSSTGHKWQSPPRSVPEGEVVVSKPKTSSMISTSTASSNPTTLKRNLTIGTSKIATAGSEVYREQRASPDIFRHEFDSTRHPFGRELEQLDEIAEEFGGTVRDAAREEDLKVMKSRGLKRFCAADYMLDLTPMWECWFEGRKNTNKLVGWI